MEINFGKILIVFIFCISLISLFPLVQSINGKKMYLKTFRYIYYSAFIFIAISYIILLAAFIFNDFSYAYVYENSSKDLSVVYLIAASWAGQSGSFLLWLLLLSIFGLFIINSDDEHEDILMTVMVISQMVILMVLIKQSPFEYIWENPNHGLQPGQVPVDGTGLNQLLIDPWMITHPPVLFIGYASALIPFGYAIAALIRKDYTTWINNSFRWLLVSMTSLGIGIFLGAYWAYTVLGWGGYWGWDPVENSSLIPWIISVALVHSMVLMKRKKAFVKTTIFLSLSYYILVFYGTFLTRSGVLSDFSVHSFADLGIGNYLIFIIMLYIVIALIFFFYRFKEIESNPISENMWSWDNFMAYGVIAIILYGIFVLIGTSMPIITKILTKLAIIEKASAVNISIYNKISLPFGVVLLFVMIISSMLILAKDLNNKNNIVLFSISLLLGFLFNFPFVKTLSLDSILFFVLSIISTFVILRYIVDFSQANFKVILPSRMIHIGLGILVLGVISSNIHSTKEQKVLIQGQEEKFSKFILTFKEYVPGDKASLKFEINKDGSKSEFFTPYFIEKKMRSLYREPHIINDFDFDTYIIPENYMSGAESANTIVLVKGEQKQVGNLKIKFIKFDISGMRSERPKVGAELLVNDRKLSIYREFSPERGDIQKEIKIPGSNRTISLNRIDANTKSVLVNLSPGNESETPPDSVVVNVSYKRFIWLVWLGTILISVGGIVSFIWNKKKFQ